MKRGIMLNSAVRVATEAVSHVSATTNRGRLSGDRAFDTQLQRKCFRLVAVVLGLSLCESVAALSLDDIIQLSRGGYGDQEITSLIAATGTRFDLDVDSLTALTTAGVSEPVIQDMLQAGNRQPSGNLLASLTSEVRTDARGLDGALAETTVDDILQLYRAGLSDATIDALVDGFESVGSPYSSVLIEHLGGAVARVEPESTAFGTRDAAYDCVIMPAWTEPSESDTHIAWADDLWQSIQPDSTGGVYVNYMGDEGEARVRAAYGANHTRLAKLKAKYDPNNLFRFNQNIRPASS